MAVNKFTGATNANWGTSTNWSQGTVPTATDGHTTTFDGTSPACTVDTSARVCNNLTFVGYTNTITMTFQITVSGNITLGSGMGVAGSGVLIGNETGTWTSNGKTWPNGLNTGGTSKTITLGDNWTVTGTVTLSPGTAGTMNGNTMNCSGSLTSTNVVTSGTTSFVMNGTGTLSMSGGVLSCNLTFNTAGTITINANCQLYSAVITYTAGTMNLAGSTLTINNSGTTTLNTSGMTWINITMNTSAVTTLTSNLNISGTFRWGSGGSSVTVNGAFNITCTGTLTSSGTATFGSTLTGTATVVISGAAAWNNTSAFPATIRNNLSINCTTLTISGTQGVGFDTGTMTYTAGAITTTGSTLTIGASCTLNVSGMDGTTTNKWNNITISTTATITLSSNLYLSGTFTNTAGNNVINGNTLHLGGGLTMTAGQLSGTTSFLFNGTGTWNGNVPVYNNLTINTAGTLTIATVQYGINTFTYTAGTVNCTTTFTVPAAGTGVTINSSGIQFNNFTMSGGGSFSATVSSDVTVNALLTLNNTSNTSTINGSSIFHAKGGLTIGGSGAVTITGNCSIIMEGTGTLQSSATNEALRLNLTINTSGTITLGANFAYNTGVFTYTAGTVNSSTNSCVLNISASTTINSNGMSWFSVSFLAAATITLSSDFTSLVGGTFIQNVNSSTVTLNGFTIYIGGSLGNNSAGANSPIFNGTSNFVMNGTGNLGNAISNSTGLIIKNNVTINTSGTITLLGYFRYSTGTFTYTSGTVNTSTNTSTIQFDGTTTTVNIAGVDWYNVSTITAVQTITLNSNLSILNNLTMSTFNTTFAGTGVWTCANLIIGTAGSALTHTLVINQTYTITTSMTVFGTSALHHTIKSSSAGTSTILRLLYGASQDIDYCNATDVDSSGGQTIWDFKGTLSNATNWQQLVANKSVAKTFVY